jgi:glutaredoxin
MDTLNLDFLSGHRLEVYSTTWCPDCRRLDRWLAEQALEHSIVDIEDTPGAARRLEQETGKRAVPFVLVDGRSWVRGYHRERPGRFDPRLLVDELRAAVGG